MGTAIIIVASKAKHATYSGLAQDCLYIRTSGLWSEEDSWWDPHTASASFKQLNSMILTVAYSIPITLVKLV